MGNETLEEEIPFNQEEDDEEYDSLMMEERKFPPWYYKLRKFVHHNVEGNLDSYFEFFILFLIFLNVISFMVGTIEVGPTGPNPWYGPCDRLPPYDQSNCESLDEKYSIYFEVFEGISVIIFTIEYIGRIWSCIEFKKYQKKGMILGRLRYMVTFFCIVDVLSIVPWYINLIFYPNTNLDFSWIRIFRLVRIFKADHYVNAFALLGKVIMENGALLIATVYYAALVLVIFTTIFYYTERNAYDHESYLYYQSIPQGLFPTTLMLTGEFPLVDFTPPGQFFAGLIGKE
eukprot:TRINITY_DN941_c0_g1_i1.p1 TRINITY_DN941_c0_g1~~TRINITY_DN941_c0_g1_i1.p1  ORF type:complete len:287 (-),score=71.02 TRINITY_DN941_c0_g1_i1:479-1339(-)